MASSAAQDMVKILYLNNAGGGFAERHPLKQGTTIMEFFSSQFVAGEEGEEADPDSYSSPSSYSILVNRAPVVGTYVLKDNDIVTITPVKVGGGRNWVS